MKTPRMSSALCALMAVASPLISQQFRSDRPLDVPLGSVVIEVVDIDGDNQQDLFIQEFPSTFYLRLGDLGRFGPPIPVSFSTSPQGTLMVAAGDVDGDGDTDLVVGVAAPFPPRLLRNDGNGLLTDVTATQMPAVTRNAGATRLFDADADGDLDLLIAARFQDALFRNNGNGFFSDVTSTQLPPDTFGVPEEVRDVAVADVDGDNDLDYIVATAAGPLLRLNDGSGTFAAAPAPLAGSDLGGVEFGDFDQNGTIDIFYAVRSAAGTSQDRLFSGLGGGLFAEVTNASLPNDGELALGAVSEDMDGDGDRDILVINEGQSTILLNDGAGTFADGTAGRLTLGSTPAAQLSINRELGYLRDLDSDGDLDLRLSPSDGPNLLRNVGDATFEEIPLGGRPAPIVTIDADGDGDLDVVANDSGDLVLLDNDGSGQLTARTGALPALLADAIAAGDVDGDGDTDLITVQAGVGVLLLNDGSGTFTDGTTGRLSATGIAGGGLIDIDNDGDLDLVGLGGVSTIFVPPTTMDQLFVNDGSGVFTDVTASALPVGRATSLSVDAADFDNDGDTDLLLGSGLILGGEPGDILLNQGNGTFVVGPALPLSAALQGTRGIFADVDADGDIDIVMATSTLRIAENVGGTLVDATSTRVPTAVSAIQQPVAVDIDLDGDIDLTTGTNVMLNDGTGVFLSGLGRFNTPPDFDLVADIDRDGDADLLSATEVQVNRHRQLSLRLQPRVRTLVSSVIVDAAVAPGYGTTSGFVFLAYSLARRPQPLVDPTFGAVFLDPASLVTAGAIAIPVAGEFPFGLPLRPDPNLVGLEVHFQALLGSATVAPRVSNLVSTRIH